MITVRMTMEMRHVTTMLSHLVTDPATLESLKDKALRGRARCTKARGAKGEKSRLVLETADSQYMSLKVAVTTKTRR